MSAAASVGMAAADMLLLFAQTRFDAIRAARKPPRRFSNRLQKDN
jgi:hypothetical protein